MFGSEILEVAIGLAFVYQWLMQGMRLWKDTPGKGAGTPVDVRASGRRKAAKALESRQRGTAA